MKVGVSYDTIDIFSVVIVDLEGLQFQRISKKIERFNANFNRYALIP